MLLSVRDLHLVSWRNAMSPSGGKQATFNQFEKLLRFLSASRWGVNVLLETYGDWGLQYLRGVLNGFHITQHILRIAIVVDNVLIPLGFHASPAVREKNKKEEIWQRQMICFARVIQFAHHNVGYEFLLFNTSIVVLSVLHAFTKEHQMS